MSNITQLPYRDACPQCAELRAELEALKAQLAREDPAQSSYEQKVYPYQVGGPGVSPDGKDLPGRFAFCAVCGFGKLINTWDVKACNGYEKRWTGWLFKTWTLVKLACPPRLHMHRKCGKCGASVLEECRQS